MDSFDRQVAGLINAGYGRREAEQIIEARMAAREARQDAEIAKIQARADEIAGQVDLAITSETAEAVAKVFAKTLNKNRRGEIQRIVGDKWNRLANPQTRDAGIASLTEAEGRKITGR